MNEIEQYQRSQIQQVNLLTNAYRINFVPSTFYKYHFQTQDPRLQDLEPVEKRLLRREIFWRIVDDPIYGQIFPRGRPGVFFDDCSYVISKDWLDLPVEYNQKAQRFRIRFENGSILTFENEFILNPTQTLMGSDKLVLEYMVTQELRYPNIGKDNLDWFGMENKFIYRPFGKDLQQFPEVIQNITAPIFQALVVNMKQAKDKKLVLATGLKSSHMSLLHFFAFKYTNNSESLNCILKKGHTLTTKAKELFVKLFANKNVSTTYSPKNYTFQNLSKRNAFQSTFTFNGEDMSIVNYFSKHAIKLDYPQLPLALLKMKKFDEPIRLPLELLRVSLRVVHNEIESSISMRAQIIKATAKEPQEYFKQCAQTVDCSGMKDSTETMKAFDIGFEKGKAAQFMRLKGKLLPEIKTSQTQSLIHTPVPFTIEMYPVHFDNLDDGECSQVLIKKFAAAFSELPIRFNVHPLKSFNLGERQNFLEHLNVIAQNANDNTLILCVLQRNETEIYNQIKKLDKKVTTQCITVPIVEKWNRERKVPTDNVQSGEKVHSILKGLVCKINTKMGGQTKVIPADYDDLPSNLVFNQFVENNTMFIGITSCLTQGNESVLAMAFNTDAEGATYAGVPEFETGHHSFFKNFSKRFETALFGYYYHRERLPSNIIVFRTGLSDSVVDCVAQREIYDLEKLFKKIGKENWPERLYPKFVYLNVTRGHIMRFGTIQKDRVDNPKPGTIIDSGVTEKDGDFYLYAHEGIGTLRPPFFQPYKSTNRDFHMNFSNEMLQTLCYGLCHLNGSSNCVTAMPAPVYHAEKLKNNCLRKSRVSDKVETEFHVNEFDNRMKMRAYFA